MSIKRKLTQSSRRLVIRHESEWIKFNELLQLVNIFQIIKEIAPVLVSVVMMWTEYKMLYDCFD